MVKTPNVRHSKTRKDPLTIDLEASRVPSEEANTPETSLETSPETETAASEALERPQVVETSAPGDAAPTDEAALRDTTGSAEPLTGASANATTDYPEDVGFASSSAAPASDIDATSAASAGSSTSETASARDTSGYGRGAAGSASAAAASNRADAPRPRRGSTLAAGLAGGVAAALIFAGLQYAGVFPAPGARSDDPAAVSDLRGQVEALQTEIASIRAGGTDAGVPQEVTDLQARVDAMTADLDAVKKAVETGAAGEGAGLAALQERLTGLEGTIAQLQQNGGNGQVDLAPLTARIDGLEKSLAASGDAASATDGRIAALEQSVTRLSQEVATLTEEMKAQGDQPKIALSIAASALKAAVNRGQPFAAELETLGAIAPDLPQLAELRAQAEKGVASREDLDAEMDAAANAMIAAADRVDRSAGYLDQLWQSASSLVTVRPVGAVPGEGVPEKVARMEAALKAGDLAAALAEYDTLPDGPKNAGAAFAARIKERLDVERLVDQAIAEAMKTV